MGFFSRKVKKESIRLTTNTDDENGLYFDPVSALLNISDCFNDNELNQFRLLKSERTEKYNSFDLMGQDSRVSSILNMYADDCTQYNQAGKIIWAESADADCAEFVNRLIENLQLNKYAWSHIYSLSKYGDLYLQLFYEDETDIDDLKQISNDNGYKRPKGSMLTEHIEMVQNPASIFDLVRHGKTDYYVKINTDDESGFNLKTLNTHTMYSGLHNNNIILPADKFIHISINNAFNRYPNKYVIRNFETNEETIYDIKEGNSILSNAFKTWSELSLLEDSVLLNRLSKSAIIRLIQIEVGNTDDDEVQNILKALRDKISRMRYFDKTNGDYKNQANPGPLENIIYNATHKGNGAITHSTIGGDVDVKALADLDYFLEKFANAFPLPLAYIKQKNDDGGGLSAGTSLTKLDARYGRTLKRLQSSYIYGITDLINVFAYKRGLADYINNFTIKMVSPSAVEDNERDEKLTSHADIIRSIMDVINNQEDSYSPTAKSKILNYLIQTLLQDNGLNDILQEVSQDISKNQEENETEINQMNINDEEDTI